MIPIIAASMLLMAWALMVYVFTDTLRPVRIAQMGLGIGVLFAVYLSVDTVYRARLIGACGRRHGVGVDPVRHGGALHWRAFPQRLVPSCQ